MFVCRTLDYIVNTDLHLYLFVKFDEIRSKGIQVEIELTEPITRIPLESEKYIEIIDMVLDKDIDSLMETTDKKMNFYMFYTDGELHLVVRYAIAVCLCNSLDAELGKIKNVQCFTTNENGYTTQHLVVTT